MRRPKPLGGTPPPPGPIGVPYGPMIPAGSNLPDPMNDALGGVMKAVGQMVYPTKPKPLSGFGGQALQCGIAGPFETPDAIQIPEAVDPPSMETAPANIPPVPIAKVDGQGRLRDLMKQAYRAMPGESADHLSKRISALNDLNAKIDALGQITPEEADEIFDGWYQSTMRPESPFAAFSPEAQSAIDEAYGGSVPQPRVAGASDIDQNELAAVAAFTLLNGLTGKGDFGDILRGVGMVTGRAQRRVDATTVALQQQDEMRRRAALERFKRITDVEDQNFKQQGYLDHDARMLDKQNASQTAVAKRQEDSAVAREKAAFQADIRRAIIEKDPERTSALIDLYEHSYGDQDLPDSVRKLSPTYAQKKTIADTERTEEDTKRIREVVEGLGIKNDLDRQSFQAELKTRIDKRLITHEQLNKIREDVRQLPEKLRLQTFKINADVETAKERARAAVIRAERAGVGRGGDPASKAVKQRLDGLKSIVTSQNTNIDNLAQRFNFWTREASSIEQQITNASVLELNDKIPDLQRRLAEAKANAKQLEEDMKTMRTRAEAAASEIDRLSLGGAN